MDAQANLSLSRAHSPNCWNCPTAAHTVLSSLLQAVYRTTADLLILNEQIGFLLYLTTFFQQAEANVLDCCGVI